MVARSFVKPSRIGLRYVNVLCAAPFPLASAGFCRCPPKYGPKAFSPATCRGRSFGSALFLRSRGPVAGGAWHVCLNRGALDTPGWRPAE